MESPYFSGGVCRQCNLSIERIVTSCVQCGAPIPAVVGDADSCLRCRSGDWPARRIFAYGVYTGTLKQAVLTIKHRGTEPLALDLGAKMGKWLGEHPEVLPYDLILPTPKHWTKLLIQRHNSAELLAIAIGRTLKTKVDRRNLRRTRSTSKQGVLLRSERANNVRGAFAIIDARLVAGRNIMLVDDVITTGSTAAAMTRTLLAAGASQVDVVCLARGLGER